MAATLKHPDVGVVTGNVVNGTAQFLGLKYASLENRFAPPKVVTDYGSGEIDASKYGQVVQIAWTFLR